MNTGRTASRRGFLKGAGKVGVAGLIGGALRPASLARAARVGRNDKVRLALIGCGGMGTRHLEALLKNKQCTVAAVCDVFKPRYEAAMGKAPEGYPDYRRVLDRKDIDAIFVPTADHWHPLITIHGCQAGKDVYVEKPACPTVAEGRAMVQAARRYGRIVQVGAQQRSMPVFQKAIKIIQDGKLGQITSASAWVGANGRNVGESVGPPSPELDWDGQTETFLHDEQANRYLSRPYRAPWHL